MKKVQSDQGAQPALCPQTVVEAPQRTEFLCNQNFLGQVDGGQLQAAAGDQRAPACPVPHGL